MTLFDLERYRAYRSYGHGWFISTSAAIPLWVLMVVAAIAGAILGWWVIA